MNQNTFRSNTEEEEKLKRFGFMRIKDVSYKSNNIIGDIKKKINLTKQTEVDNLDGESYEERLILDTKMMIESLCERPRDLTEVRRDGKDNAAVCKVIQQEFKRCEEKGKSGEELCKHMQSFASACWVSVIVFLQHYYYADSYKFVVF